MKIFVTGCNGQLGRAINLQYKDATDVTFVNTDVADLDITKVEQVMEAVRAEKPDVIVNCAAHTAVDA